MKLIQGFMVMVLLISACRKEKNFSGRYFELNDTNLESVRVEKRIDSEGLIDGKILKSDVQRTEHIDLSGYNPTGECPIFIGLADLKIFENLTFLSL